MIGKRDALIAVAGLGLCAFAIERIGWSAVVRAIEQGGAAVAIILGLSFVRLLLQTRAWSIALRADGIESSASRLMLIRLASQGMGYLSVLGPVASEPMKISLLQKSAGSATTATLVDTGVYWYTSGLVGIAGCVSAALLLAHGPHSPGNRRNNSGRQYRSHRTSEIPAIAAGPCSGQPLPSVASESPADRACAARLRERKPIVDSSDVLAGRRVSIAAAGGSRGAFLVSQDTIAGQHLARDRGYHSRHQDQGRMEARANRRR